MNATPLYGNLKPHERPISDTVLDKWLRARGISRFEFAQTLGCDPKMVGFWADNRSLPSLIYAFKISQATQGGVPPESWLGTELGRRMWSAAGVDWDKLKGQRTAERHRRRSKGTT